MQDSKYSLAQSRCQGPEMVHRGVSTHSNKLQRGGEE
jgi:hypothetical protein